MRTKTMLKQTLATFFLTALLAGCSSTPDIHEDFSASEGDSYAKTTMRLMGTNKFVDSKSGDEGTRKVVGSGAMKVLQLVSLDFMGLAQNSLSDHLIEGDYVAKSSRLLVRLDNVNEAKLTNPEALITLAEAKINSFVAAGEDKVGVATIDRHNVRIAYTFDDTSDSCKNLKGVRSCEFNISYPKVVKYIKKTQQAYVRYDVVGVVLAGHLLGSYKNDDLSLYVTPLTGFYGSKRNIQIATKVPVVINGGRVHKFIKGAKFTNGAPIDDFFMYYQKEDNETGIKKQYKINVADYTYTKIN